jgi:hypothetical protein
MVRKLVKTADQICPAVQETLDSLALEPKDKAVAKLAELYATQIDQAEDRGRAIADLGPKLLSTLTALRATPAARVEQSKGGAGNVSKLDALRAARAARTPGVHSTTA